MNKRDQSIATYTSLPYLHPSIRPDDLDENGIIKNEKRSETMIFGGKEYSTYTTLGAGDFGEVKLAQDVNSGEWLVIKKLFRPNEAEIQKEYALLQKTGMASNINENVLVMSLVSGKELFQFTQNLDTFKRVKRGLDPSLKVKLKLSDTELLQIAIGMCESIDDLNVKFNMLMLDIKLENFIYNFTTGKVIPIDYGGACEAGVDEDLTVHNPDASVSEQAMAPESASDAIYSRRSESYSVARAIADTYNLLDDDLVNIISPSDKKFKDPFKMRIENETIRKEILDILTQMTDKDNPKNRILLDEAAQQFRQLQKKYIHEEKKDLSVCVLDLAEFSKFDQNDMQKLILSIRGFDRIVLINSGPEMSQNQLLKLKLDIERYLQITSLAKISSTVTSGLPHDDLVKKACTRMQLESRRGAYNFHFSEYNKENNSIHKVNIPAPHPDQITKDELVDKMQKKLEKNQKVLSAHSYSTLFQEKKDQPAEKNIENQSGIKSKKI